MVKHPPTNAGDIRYLCLIPEPGRSPGVGHDNPLQCSFLENPTERGACWATVLLLLSHFSRVRLCATPWTAAYQASPSMGFSRQEHWSGLPFPSPGLQSIGSQRVRHDWSDLARMHMLGTMKTKIGIIPMVTVPEIQNQERRPKLGFKIYRYKYGHIDVLI